MFQIKLKIGDSEQPDILIKRYEGWYIKPQESFKTNFKAQVSQLDQNIDGEIIFRVRSDNKNQILQRLKDADEEI